MDSFDRPPGFALAGTAGFRAGGDGGRRPEVGARFGNRPG